MRKSGAVTILVVVVVLFALPPVCLPLASNMATGTTQMPGGCHGHRGPVPAHACCYATHHLLAAVQIRPLPVLLNVVLGYVSSLNHSRATEYRFRRADGSWPFLRLNEGHIRPWLRRNVFLVNCR